MISSLTWSWEKYNHFSPEDKKEGIEKNRFFFILVTCKKIRIWESLFDALELPELSVQLKVKVSQVETHGSFVCVLSLSETAWNVQL